MQAAEWLLVIGVISASAAAVVANRAAIRAASLTPEFEPKIRSLVEALNWALPSIKGLVTHLRDDLETNGTITIGQPLRGALGGVADMAAGLEPKLNRVLDFAPEAERAASLRMTVLLSTVLVVCSLSSTTGGIIVAQMQRARRDAPSAVPAARATRVPVPAPPAVGQAWPGRPGQGRRPEPPPGAAPSARGQ